MKRMFAFFAAAIVALACAACGCSNSAPATTPTIVPTVPVTIPATTPTMETNIPDPEVNDNSTMDTMPDDSMDGKQDTAPARNRNMNRGMK